MGLLSFQTRVRFYISLLISGLQVASLLKIHPKPCTNALGVQGTCMFVWDCIKIDGNHLGTCVDGFLFGSCCDQSGTKDINDSVIITSTPTITTTTHASGGEVKKPEEATPTELVMALPISITSAPLIVSESTSYSRLPLTKPTTVSELLSLQTPSKSTTSVISHTSTTTSPSTRPVSQSNTPRVDAATRSPEARNEECGVPATHAQSKVVGGTNAEFGAWPWQASVRRTSFFGFSSTHRCGGAIISRQWVATAGHCVDEEINCSQDARLISLIQTAPDVVSMFGSVPSLLLAQIRVRVGEYDFASILEPYPYVERGVKKKVVHPRYNFFTYENDLALVQLEEPLEPFPHISSICLPPDSAENLIGKNSTVTGWGRLSEGGTLPSVLQQVQLPIISNEKCKNMFLKAGRQEYIPDIFMCAGFEDGGRDSCQGDSGGPLQVQGDDGKWFLAGIISWGIGCAEANMPGVCTRISKFKDWILQNIT